MLASNEVSGKTCPICGSNSIEAHFDTCVLYNCEKCGKFKMNDFGNAPRLTEHHKLILRSFYFNIPANDKRRYDIILNNDNIDDFVESIDYPKELTDKIDIVLMYFANSTKFFGQAIKVINKNDLSIKLFCSNTDELNSIIDYLLSVGYIITPKLNTLNDVEQYIVTYKGLNYYQDLKEKLLNDRLKSKQCFVAMWFNDKEDTESYRPNMQNVYSVAIKPAIEFEERYISIKIDNVEHCNDINDEMISQIRKSKFMIADLTGYRGGVYWEAGFAEGLGIPVIYTCHEKWLNTDEDLNIEGVHFDLNHRNMILWNEENLEEFKQRLINRIGAIIV